MAKFEIAYDLTNKHEGGSKVSLNSKDSGNYTGGKIGLGQLIGSKFGISAPVLCNYLRRTAIVADMRDLSEETAKIIYRKDYWNPVHGDEILSQAEANSLYDNAVNSGVGTAIKEIQSVLEITQTGKMDTYTLTKLNNKR